MYYSNKNTEQRIKFEAARYTDFGNVGLAGIHCPNRAIVKTQLQPAVFADLPRHS